MSNVVQLKKQIAAPKKSKQRPKPDADAPLIRACVAFAQNVAACDAGYDADPTDSKYASPMGGEFSAKYENALRRIAQLSATTPEGLAAKARIVPIVIHSAAGSPDDREDNFFTSFAADVRKVIEPIVDERRRAALQAMAVRS